MRANAREHIKSFRNFGRPPLAQANLAYDQRQLQLKSTWEAEGFQSPEQAVLMCQIINPSTDPAIRATCYSALATKLDRNTQAKRPGDPKSGPTSKKPVLQLMYVPAIAADRIPMFQATLQRLQANIQLSHCLPHIMWQVGEAGTESATTLRALVDTGAGLNVGRLDYHMSIAKQHPELILQCGYLKDFEGVQPFGLGSVV